jgi:hypothetical protein
MLLLTSCSSLPTTSEEESTSIQNEQTESEITTEPIESEESITDSDVDDESEESESIPNEDKMVDFRGITIGMTADEIIALEAKLSNTSPSSNTKSTINFNEVSVMGRNAKASYLYYRTTGLDSVLFTFNLDKNERIDLIGTYNNILQDLTTDFGEPAKAVDTADTETDTIYYITMWYFKNMTISLSLHDDGTNFYEIKVFISSPRKSNTSDTSDDTNSDETSDFIDNELEIINEKSNKEIIIGELYNSSVCDFSVNRIEFSYDVKPDNPPSYYHHYEAGIGKVFVHLDVDVKNTIKQNLPIDRIGSVTIDYNNGYIYTGFSVHEDSDGDFSSYSFNQSIEPLVKVGVHYLVECPEEVATSSNPVKVIFTVDGQKYEYNLR